MLIPNPKKTCDHIISCQNTHSPQRHQGSASSTNSAQKSGLLRRDLNDRPCLEENVLANV